MSENPFINEPGIPDEGFPAPAGERREDRWYPGKYTRRCLMIGIGALATALDAAGEAVDTLANRGERVTSEWNERVEEMRRQNTDAGERVRDYARSGVNAVLDSAGVPNKGDVDTINVKLNILSRKLDEIQLQQVGASAPEPPPPPGPSSSTGQ